MKNYQIIFVDDEPNILNGLRRMLRSLRKEFDFHFAESGQQALEMMKDNSFDVIVSDMRMPGMDGATLLTEVQNLYPHSIRIMLTGQADDESVMRTVGVVHQFLVKPCEPEVLKAVLLRSCALQNLMQNGDLKNVITSIDYLPSIPEIYVKLQKKLSDPEASIEEVAGIIEADLAMSAKVLHLVNSAFFGLFQKAETPARAVNLLGLDTIKALTLGVEVFSDQKMSSSVIPLSTLWEHSMAVGTCAKKIAISVVEDKAIIDNSLLAGILHDIGKLVLVSRMSSEYEVILQTAAEKKIPLQQAEKEQLGATHCDVGAYLIGLWGMTGAIVEAIAFHRRLHDYPAESFSPALAVHIANTLYYELKPDTYTGVVPALNETYISELGLTDKIDTWREICQETLEQAEDE